MVILKLPSPLMLRFSLIFPAGYIGIYEFLMILIIKVKVTPWRAYAGSEGRRSTVPPHSQPCNRGSWISASRPKHLTPGKNPVLTAEEAEWSIGPIWMARKISPPGFEPRNFQSAAGLYSDWAMPAASSRNRQLLFLPFSGFKHVLTSSQLSRLSR